MPTWKLKGFKETDRIQILGSQNPEPETHNLEPEY